MTRRYREPVVRWLREHGLRAQAVASRWEGESDAADVVAAEEAGHRTRTREPDCAPNQP